MIITRLNGGLGNQLFQYAAGRYLAERNKTSLKLDVSFFETDKLRHYSLHQFNISGTLSTNADKLKLRARGFIQNKLKKLGIQTQSANFTEQSLGFDNRVMNLSNGTCLNGFWQSEKYFKPVEEIIRKEFVVKPRPSAINEALLEKIRSVNAVSIHVRRGDYINNSHTNALHGVCSIAYYQEAISLVAAKHLNPYFFIFSDDIEWVKANLIITRYPVEYIDHNSMAEHEDLRLMYSCKHNIIANSTFSWWGAWLNSNPDKMVVAPQKWFNNKFENNDILPAEWIRI